MPKTTRRSTPRATVRAGVMVLDSGISTGPQRRLQASLGRGGSRERAAWFRQAHSEIMLGGPPLQVAHCWMLLRNTVLVDDDLDGFQRALVLFVLASLNCLLQIEQVLRFLVSFDEIETLIRDTVTAKHDHAQGITAWLVGVRLPIGAW